MRLIDADALKEAIENHFDMLDAYFPNKFIEEIDNARTIIWCNQTSDGVPMMDLRGTKKGEWICITKSTFPQYQPDEYKCPFCNVIVHRKTNYCDNCGADMRGEDK